MRPETQGLNNRIYETPVVSERHPGDEGRCRRIPLPAGDHQEVAQDVAMAQHDSFWVGGRTGGVLDQGKFFGIVRPVTPRID